MTPPTCIRAADVRQDDGAELPVLAGLEHVKAGRSELKAADMLGEREIDIEQLARMILRDRTAI